MHKAVNVKMSVERCSGTAASSANHTVPHPPKTLPRPSQVDLAESTTRPSQVDSAGPTTPLAPARREAGERGECRAWVRGLACAICASLVFSFGSASAADPKVLTLDDALSIAMEQNRDIEKARAYGQYVQGRYLEERSAALPSLSFDAGAAYSRDESQSALRGGTSTQTRHGELRLNQTLFSWGKISAAIRGAEEGLKTAEDRLRLYQQAARRDTTVAFYDVLLAKELRALAQSNLQQKERHLAEARKRLAAGVATDYDLLAAQVAVDNARPEVIRSENRIRTAKEQLRLVLALEGGEIEVAGNLEKAPVAVPGFEEALTTARARRPELSELRHRVGIYRELVQIASAGNKPTVEFAGSAGWRQLQAGGDSFDGPAWAAGINLSFPFFDGFRTKGKVQQARSDLRTGELEVAQQLDAVSLEVRNAGFAVTEAEQIVNALTGTVRQAERLLAMAEQGYQLGVKIRLEVEDAELNVVQARSNLAQARRDYQVALVNLAWATGTLGEMKES